MMIERAKHTLTGVLLGCAVSVVGLMVGLVL